MTTSTTSYRRTLRRPVAGELQSIRVAPNPLTGSTEVRWEQPGGSTLLSLYSARGELVRRFESAQGSAGRRQVTPDVHDLPAGSYLLELRAGKDVVRRQVVVVR